MTASDTIERPLQATLHELGLNSSDPGGLATFYRTALGYSFVETADGLFGAAPNRRLRIRHGMPRSLAYAGYAVPNVDELDALERRLKRANAAFSRSDIEGFAPQAISVEDPNGNHFIFGVPVSPEVVGDSPTARRPARVQHVVFASTDIERSLSFYTNVLGFTLSDRVVDDEGGLRTAFVRCSHEHHSLAVFAASEDRLDHFCYEAGDWNLIRDWADDFARHRIPLKWGPGRHGPGNNLFLFIHDPDGNWVELSAELEHVAPDRPVGNWPHEEYTLNSWGIGLLRS